MSRIAAPAVEAASDATAELFAQIKKAAGDVPNTFAMGGGISSAIARSLGASVWFTGTRSHKAGSEEEYLR
jgi:hypothetical protein